MFTHLEVDDHKENKDRRKEVGDVRHVGAIESLLQCADLVRAGDEEMEEGDDSTLKLSATASVNSSGAKCLPDDALALVSRDEQGDTRAKAVALGQELIQQDDDDAGHKELHNDEDRVSSAKIAHVTVDAGDDVSDSLTDGDQHAEKLLGAVAVEAWKRRAREERSDLNHRRLHRHARGSGWVRQENFVRDRRQRPERRSGELTAGPCPP